MKEVSVKIINKSNYPIPAYATSGSSGVDLYANIDKPIDVSFGEVCLIPTGIHIGLPLGYEAQIRARSGLAIKEGVFLVNGVGTVDSDYTGEIKVIISTVKKEGFRVIPGMRIAQMVINEYAKANFEEAESLEETQRGSGGFGSTGR